jgi:hypothetical protein
MKDIENRDAFIGSLGTFNETKISKKLARQGQAMSSSTFITTLSKDQYKVINDVAFNGYEFSDGCGYISSGILQKVCDKFEVYKASAIQMRFGEFKGVLMEHPSLTGEQVFFRKSMKKF